MDRPSLVPPSHGAGLRHTTSDSAGRTRLNISAVSSPPTNREHGAPLIRLEAIRKSLGQQGFSDSVVQLLLGGNRPSTESSYHAAWNSWRSWNVRRGSDPLSGDLTNVLQYLTDVHTDGKSYSLINVHRSMLSGTLTLAGGESLGSHPLVIRLLKSCYNLNPPRPRYSHTWDPDLVLEFMKTDPDGDSFLPHKLATLLALATFMRVSDLAIDKRSIVFEPDHVHFHLSRPRKTQHKGQLQSFKLRKNQSEAICPVRCMGTYIYKTDVVRNHSNSLNLFVGLIKPHSTASSTSIAHWIKTYLSRAGINTSIFSAHSTRSAAAS